MQRARFRIGLAFFAMILAGCESPPPRVVEQALTLAVARQPTSVLYFIALEHKLFEKHGLKVELKIYPSGKRALEEGLLTGVADMANSFDTPLALAAFDHPELRVLAATVRADNIFYIVARGDRGIQQAGDLRGRSVATQAGSAVHFFLQQFLLEHGLSGKDVRLEFHKIEALPELLEIGQVDAVSVREPYLSQCREKLGERAKFFVVPGIYEQTELLVTTEKLLRERPAVARAALAALLEAEAFVQPVSAAAAITARYLNMSENDVIRDLPNFRIRVDLSQSVVLLLEDLARWGIDSGLVRGEVPDYLDILAPDVLTELAPERVNLIR